MSVQSTARYARCGPKPECPHQNVQHLADKNGTTPNCGHQGIAVILAACAVYKANFPLQGTFIKKHVMAYSCCFRKPACDGL